MATAKPPKGYKVGPVNFWQALGVKADIKWPKLEPKFSKTLAEQAPSQPSSQKGGAGKGSTPPPPKAAGGYIRYAQALLAQHGWASQWVAFNAVVMRESSWNPNAQNPTSPAYGIAQALGHGNANTQGTKSNSYGGYGLTDAQARAANSGNGYWQLVWMMNYIRQTYGDPNGALRHEQQYGNY